MLVAVGAMLVAFVESAIVVVLTVVATVGTGVEEIVLTVTAVL